MRSDAGECLEQSHEHLVVRAVLIVAHEPLKLLVNTHQNLQSMNRNKSNQSESNVLPSNVLLLLLEYE